MHAARLGSLTSTPSSSFSSLDSNDGFPSSGFPKSRRKISRRCVNSPLFSESFNYNLVHMVSSQLLLGKAQLICWYSLPAAMMSGRDSKIIMKLSLKKKKILSINCTYFFRPVSRNTTFIFFGLSTTTSNQLCPALCISIIFWVQWSKKNNENA